MFSASASPAGSNGIYKPRMCWAGGANQALGFLMGCVGAALLWLITARLQ